MTTDGVSHSHAIGKPGRAVLMACQCGLLLSQTVPDEAGVVRLSCACGIVATMPVEDRQP